jgi:hypothetical protein
MSGFLSSVSTFLAGDKTEIEKKLDQALSKENWGAPTTLLREIAVATQNPCVCMPVAATSRRRTWVTGISLVDI